MFISDSFSWGLMKHTTFTILTSSWVPSKWHPSVHPHSSTNQVMNQSTPQPPIPKKHLRKKTCQKITTTKSLKKWVNFILIHHFFSLSTYIPFQEKKGPPFVMNFCFAGKIFVAGGGGLGFPIPFPSQILLLMAEIRLTTWDVWNPINTGINYQPQLVSRISAINSITSKQAPLYPRTPCVTATHESPQQSRDSAWWSAPKMWEFPTTHTTPIGMPLKYRFCGDIPNWSQKKSWESHDWLIGSWWHPATKITSSRLETIKFSSQAKAHFNKKYPPWN